VGQLKTSLSHLEYENEQLKRSVAKLQRENRSMEDRLVQEQIDNGDLAARLDDARNLLRDRGAEADVRVGSRRRGERSRADDDYPAGQTVPTSQGARQRRKPPFAKISGQLGVLPPEEDDDGSAAQSRKARDSKADRARRLFDDDLDHHSYHNGPLRWLPVAQGGGASQSELR